MPDPNLLNMEHPELDDRLREPLDEEERILMDPDTWDWESAEEVLLNPDGYSITEVELSYDDLVTIERAAIAEGMTVSAFLRHVALERAFQAAPR